MGRNILILGLVALLLPSCTSNRPAAPEAEPTSSGTVRFEQSFYSAAKRLRVNSPDTATGPYKDRWEAKEKGESSIDLPGESLENASDAHLYLELWGGHPGVADKQVSANQNPWVALPESGSEQNNCTYTYPRISIPLTDLKAGQNRFQFTCEKGTTFWGHYLIDNTALVVTLDKPPIRDFFASVEARPAAGEKIQLELDASSTSLIESVDYQGYYAGYNENGESAPKVWHGFTKDRKPQAYIGSSGEAPFRVEWDLSMIPDQKDMAVRAIIHFKGRPDLTAITPQLKGLSTPMRNAKVKLFASKDLPHPFWSRDGHEKTCAIEVNVDPRNVERAELHLNLWDGGRGKVVHPITLNGHPLEAAGEGKHDLIYRVIPIAPEFLEKGRNSFNVLSDTPDHGIEVLLPGPTLVVRYRQQGPTTRR